MLKYVLCGLVVVLIFVIAHIVVSRIGNRPTENFDSGSNLNVGVELFNSDLMARQSLNHGTLGDAEESGNARSSGESRASPRGNSKSVRKSDIERAARAAALTYCPVPPDYNPANYIKKSEIDFAKACPKMPDLKDYVLKSTIPPVQKCPSCVCPKVKVSAGMCKECPKPKNNCPKPAPCGVEQCKDVIKCDSDENPVSCPKCPPPQPCPSPPEKVCPAFELPSSDIKCPAPKPCAAPTPCPDKQGRCPEQPKSKCKYYGIKEVAKERSINDMVNEMLLSDDPKLKELLETLKYKLNINLEPAPTQNNINAIVTTKSNIPTTSNLLNTTSSMKKTTAVSQPLSVNAVPAPAPTTAPFKEVKPEAHNTSEEEYSLNNYRYSTINNLGYLGEPKPTFDSKIQSNKLNDREEGLGCDINDANCSYNTNLNI